MRELHAEICDFINKQWVANWQGSLRSLATELDIDEKTLRKIVNHEKLVYHISLYTLEKICGAKDLKLEQFFRLIKR